MRRGKGKWDEGNAMERAVWLRDFVLCKQLFDLAGTIKMTKAARWKDHLAAFNF